MKSPQLTRNIIIAVVVLLMMCGGLAIIYRIFTSAKKPAPLPEVPTYEFVTPALTTPTLLLTGSPTSTPFATATSQPFSFLSLFGSTQTPTPTKTSILLAPNLAVRTATRTPQILNVLIPTQTRTTTPTSTSAQPIQPLPGAVDCKNILYPMVPGQAWTYVVTAGSHSVNVLMTIVSVGGSQGVVDVVNQAGGTTRRTVATCDKDTILNFPALSAEVLLSSALSGNINAEYVSGILAPNEAAFLANNWAISWTTQYRVSGNSTINFRGNDLNVTVNPSNMAITCQTLGAGNAAFETVTVSAGTFNSLKIVCRGQGQVTGIVNGSTITGQISAQSTQWFAPHLGMVKMQSDFANMDVFGVTIPIDTSGVNERLELTSFRTP